MPKKHPARGRNMAQAQRPQPKHKDVVLVQRASATQVVEVEEGSRAAQERGEEKKKEALKGKTEPAREPAKTKASATKASAAPVKTPEQRGAAPARSSAQPTRALRPGQRSALRPHERAMASRAQLVSAENYRYVLKDLRLIGILAAVMFGAIVALTFIVPHLSFLNY